MEDKVCKLCQNKVILRYLQLTGDIVKEILDVLLLQINFNSQTSVICNACTEKFLAAFQFKSTCLYTEDVIFPYINGAETSHLDLKEIYMKVNKNQNLKEVLDDQKICRLCFKLGKVNFKMISEINFDVLLKFLPEVNFAVTTNPVICMKCHDALHVHSSFIRNCMHVGKKPNMLLTNLSIKTEEVEIKLEPIDNEEEEQGQGDTSLHLYDLDDLKQTSAQSTVTIYNCTSESRFADHELSHKRDSKIQVNNRDCNRKSQCTRKNQQKSITKGFKLQVYKCNECIFKSRHKSSFITHQLIHKDPSEVRMFECDQCDYKSILKGYLKKHQLRHKDPSEVRMFECNECDFKSIHKGSLKRHQLRHKDPSKVQMFKCDECGYKSFRKGDVKKHQLTHRDPSEVQMFKCDECNYKSARKDVIKQHQLRHKDPSKVQMSKCDECDYRTIQRSDLKRHQLGHKDLSEVQMFKCDQCDFKSIHKKNLRDHQLMHKDLSEVQMFQCNDCDYKTKHKRYLKWHQLGHKEPSEVEMFQCNECDYKTKRKKNLKRHLLRHKL